MNSKEIDLAFDDTEAMEAAMKDLAGEADLIFPALGRTSPNWP